ncbi:uncharacterized protein LMH87_008450 [Akanthomyces muscarius]|uniref:Uncharacterized protein n=1 Tax=Akanthomyces muscarius TaxID=2231603 RepID=A0A9W8QL73_AKAMU|nr:uncharacterized protein LMH87_008450 [Akanthomyces muscarius]KAJ4159552.1 hypothetical protein LMH87_008450 [Akanthomyces muscarius]
MELLSTIYEWLSCVATRKAEPKVRSHIEAICAAHAEYQASCPLPDNYPPHFASSDGRLISDASFYLH